jgi:hypothetical protein
MENIIKGMREKKALAINRMPIKADLKAGITIKPIKTLLRREENAEANRTKKTTFMLY